MRYYPAITIVAVKYNGKSNIRDGTTAWKKEGVSKPIVVPFCEVQLHDQKKRQYIKSTFSDRDGKYSFNNLNMKDYTFFVIAHHPASITKGVISDNIGGCREMDN